METPHEDVRSRSCGLVQRDEEHIEIPAPPVQYNVSIIGHSYYVVHDGEEHLIGKDKYCHICRKSTCRGVGIVAGYLRSGGRPAPYTFNPRFASRVDLDLISKVWRVPDRCPVCGGNVEYDMRYNHRKYGPGWRCEHGGIGHLYQTRYAHLESWMTSRRFEND